MSISPLCRIHLLLLGAFLVLTGAPSQAQSEPKSDSPSRHAQRKNPIRSLTISGEILIPTIYRTDFFDDQFRGSLSSNNDDLYIDPVLKLHLDLDLEKNIRGRITLQNDRRAVNNLANTLQEKTASQRGGEDNLELEIEELYVQMDRFPSDDSWLRIGIQDFRYVLRYDSPDAFFIDISHAESPYFGSVNLEAAGLRGRTTTEWMDQVLALDVFGFTLIETGLNSSDESIFGINLDLSLSGPPKRDHLINFLLVGMANDDQIIGTLGLGASIFLTPNLEIYGEGLGQLGTFFESGQSPLNPLDTQRHQAYGGRLGFRYSWNQFIAKPFVECSVWVLSGDDNEPGRSVNRDLVTYENVDETWVVEGDEYGLDLDSNYWATKFRVGFDLTEQLDEDVRVELGVAHFEALDAPAGRSRHIGTEIDLGLTWDYSNSLQFRLGAGFLFGSQFFKNASQNLGIGGKDHAMILFIETRLRF